MLQRHPRLLLWGVLVALVFAGLVWAVPHLWYSGDDWWNLLSVRQGVWLQVDETRPLILLPVALLYALFGENLTVLFVATILAQAVAAGLFMEVCRRIFARWLGANALFAAFLVAAIYAVFPSDVSRHVVAVLPHRVHHCLIFAAAWCWISACEKNQFRWILAAGVLAVVALLLVEQGFLVLGLLPFLLLYYRGLPLYGWRWYVVLGLWFVGIGIYFYFRSSVAGGLYADLRPIARPTIADVLQSLQFNLISLTVIQLTLLPLEFTALAQSPYPPDSIFVVFLLIVFAVLMIGLWRVYVARQQSFPGRTVFWHWLITLVAGLALLGAGSGVFLARGTTQLAVFGFASRDTYTATIGISLMLGGLMLWQRRLWLAVALTILFVSIGLVRQIEAGKLAAEAGDIQRQFWSQLLRYPITWEDDAVYVIHGLPGDTQLGTATANSWFGFESLFTLFINRTLDVDTTALAAPTTWVFDGATLTRIHPYGQTEEDANALRLIVYDPLTGSIRIAAEIPPELLQQESQAVPLFTGVNAPYTAPEISDLARRYVPLDTPRAGCVVAVHVTTPDAAPQAGSVVVATMPDNQVIDRRKIAAGERLDYTFAAACNTAIQLRFLSSDDDALVLRAHDPAMEHLPAETGTTTYETAFENSQ
jgi:hypothetical protein